MDLEQYYIFKEKIGKVDGTLLNFDQRVYLDKLKKADDSRVSEYGYVLGYNSEADFFLKWLVAERHKDLKDHKCADCQDYAAWKQCFHLDE